MESSQTSPEAFVLPEDLAEQVAELAARINESPRFLVIAAVDHFFRISEEQRKAVIRGTSRRRRE
ncbi:MAG: hypothetical protein HY914_03515 [Desulfomonile tiedjei]|nr:hypothetical protein [Desulfomonile tiedjei]